MNKVLMLGLSLTLLLVAAAVVAAAGAYYGAFSKVVVLEQEIGPFHVVYRELNGVNSTAIRKIKADLGSELSGRGVVDLTSFDIFYPRNSGVPNRIGFEVSAADAARASRLAGLGTQEIEAGTYLTAAFPYKGPPSYFLAAFKVDAAFKAHRKANGYGEAFAASRFAGDAIFCLQPVVSNSGGS